jgi:hypothetical protein
MATTTIMTIARLRWTRRSSRRGRPPMKLLLK